MKTLSKTSTAASLLAIAISLGWTPAFAQGPAAEPTASEEIVVTGSRLAKPREAASVPIATVTAQEFELTGTVNAEALLNTLPQFIPATTAASNSLASATGTGASNLDLRGLGATRNLVLVNGRRFVFFDSTQVTAINAVPSNLVARTEVVTGGASAVYGSDAIAGVVNFILKDDFEGFEVRGQYTTDTQGDGPVYDVTLTWGTNFADGRGNLTASLNYLDRSEIDTADRLFSSANLQDQTVNGQRVLAFGGSTFVPNGRFTGVPFSAAARAANPALNSALIAAGLNSLDANGFIPAASGQTQRPFVRPADDFDYSVDNFLRVPQERWSLNAFGHYDLTPTLRLFSEFHYSRNETVVGFASSFINENLQFEVNNPLISPQLQAVFAAVDATDANPNNGRILLNPNRRLSEVGPRRNFDNRDAWRGLIGLEGDLGSVSENFLSDLRFEAYYSYAYTENEQIQIGNVSRQRFAAGVLSGSGGPNGAPIVNPFGPNISAAGVAFIRVNSTNIEETDLHAAAATLFADIVQLPAGPLAASLGVEARESSVEFKPDQLLAAGDIAGFNPITATNGSIRVWEVFGEVQVPLIAGAPLIDSFTVNGAFRNSNYDLDNVESVWTYQGGADWRITPDITLGGQYQRAIRAPNVGEAFGGQRAFPTQATDPCALPTAATNATIRALCIATGVPAALVGNAAVQPNAQIPGLLGGNPNLEEEESDTITFGVLFTPRFAPNLRVSVDYFDIEVDGAIGAFAGGVANILSLCYTQIQSASSAACQAIGRDPTSGVIDNQNPVRALNANLGRLETSGVDAQVQYGLALPFGLYEDGSRLDLAVNATWLDTFVIVPLSDLPGQFNDCLGLFGPVCGEPKSEYRATTRLSWTTGPLTVSARHRYIGEVDLEDIFLPIRRGQAGPPATNFAVPKIGSEQYVDVAFQYEATERFRFWGGVNNLFDNEPPLLGTRQRRNNTFPDTYDAIGTEVFIGAALRM